MDVKTFKKDMDYFFRISKYVLPKKQNVDVFSHKLDGQNINEPFNRIYEPYIGNITI